VVRCHCESAGKALRFGSDVGWMMELMDEILCLCYSPPPISLFHTWSSLSQLLFLLRCRVVLVSWTDGWKACPHCVGIENISCCSSESQHGPLYHQQIFSFSATDRIQSFLPICWNDPSLKGKVG